MWLKIIKNPFRGLKDCPCFFLELSQIVNPCRKYDWRLISQKLLGFVWDFKLFWVSKFWSVFLRLVTSAKYSSKMILLAIFRENQKISKQIAKKIDLRNVWKSPIFPDFIINLHWGPKDSSLYIFLFLTQAWCFEQWTRLIFFENFQNFYKKWSDNKF